MSPRRHQRCENTHTVTCCFHPKINYGKNMRQTLLAIMAITACTVGEPKSHVWPPSTTSTTTCEASGSSGESSGEGEETGSTSTSTEGDDESGSGSSSSTGEQTAVCVQHWISLNEELAVDFTNDSCLTGGTDLMPLGVVLTIQPTTQVSMEDAMTIMCLAPEYVQDLLFFPAVEECRDQLTGMGCDTGVLDYPNLATSLCYHALRPMFDLPLGGSYEVLDAVDACQEAVSC